MANVLRERQVPKARVLARIKDPVYGASERRFVELLGFTQANTSTLVSGQGTATITFPNFKSSLIRFISLSSVQKKEKKDSGIETVCEDIYEKYLYDLTSKEWSKNLSKNVWNDMALFRGDVSLQDLNNMGLLEYSRSAGDLSTDANRNIIDRIKKDRIMYALPFLDLFDPIFVDYLGQDGFWYAGFTGLVSQIGESYAKTGGQSITISAKDPSMLFDNGSVVSGWHRMSKAEKDSNLRSYLYASESNIRASKTAAYQNIFGSDKYNKVSDIIKEVLRVSQELWRLDDGRFGNMVGVKDFLWDVSNVYAYNGISNRRGSTQYVPKELENMNPEYFKVNYSLTDSHYIYTGKSESQKKIFMDPSVLEFDNKFIHKLLSNSLSLYKDSLKSADAIITDLAARMLANKYFDPNGNLVIDLPKLNAVPNHTDYAGRSYALIIKHRVPKKSKRPASTPEVMVVKNDEKRISVFVSKYKKNPYNYTGLTAASLVDMNGGYGNSFVFRSYVGKDKQTHYFLREGARVIVSKGEKPVVPDPLEDIKMSTVEPLRTVFAKSIQDSDDYNRHTILFHGNNYILTDDDFVGFNTSIDESGLYTMSAMDMTYPWLEKLNEDLLLSSASLHGVALADYDKLAKMGVRRYQTQNLYNVNWPSPYTGARVLSYQSAAILERINAQADSGTIQLNHRPDLQVGRNYLNLLRFKLYFITGVSNSWAPGGAHTTTLTVSYGHPMHKALEVPWLALFSEPEVFDISSPDAFFKKLKPVGEDGDNKENQELSNPKGGV